jgi:predicted Zn-dependent peptidase
MASSKKPFIRKVFPSGLTGIVIPQKDQRTVTVLVTVEAGSKYETKEKNGLSHFLEHMMFKGTTNRPATSMISELLDGLGAEYNAFTSQEWTGYYAKTRAEQFPQVLDILSDLYLNPLLETVEIEKEKGVISDELNMYEDLPMRRVGEYFMELLYGDQPAGWPIGGYKEVIRTFTREDFLVYRKAHYVAKATKVIVAGNVDPKKALSMIAKAFATTPKSKKSQKSKVTPNESGPRVHLKAKASDQAHLVLGFPGFPVGHKDYHIASVLSGVLGSGMSSRLFRKVRDEMGVGYYVRAEQDGYTDHGYFAASAGVAPDRIDEVIAAILKEFELLTTTLVSKEELAKVKEHMIGRMYLGLEGTDDLATHYGLAEVMRRPLRTPEEIAKKIQSVKPKDLQRIAKALFKKSEARLALIGPYSDTRHFQKLLQG